MGKCAIGIDIGAGSIKLVELEKTSDGIQLVGDHAKFFDLTQFPDQEKRESLIKEGLQGILRAAKIRGGRAAISLSGQSVFIRHLKLPKIQKSKIDKIIRYEAQQQIPFPLEKITWDNQIFRSGAGLEEDVLFVAAKREIVENALGYLSRTGLEAELVDVSPLSLLNAITYNEPLGKGIILDIGAKATNLIIVEEKGFWVRSILIAGDEMTHAIASQSGIPFDKAEELKKKHGLLPDAEAIAVSDVNAPGKDLPSLLAPVLTDLVNSIVQSLEFYRSKHSHELVFREIILSGGGSKLKGIEDFLASHLHMQIRRANLAQKIKCPSNLRVDIDFQTRFGAAIGLALRLLQRCPTTIDLLPPEQKAERDFKKERLWVIGAGLCLAFIPFTIGLNLWMQADSFRSQLRLLDKNLVGYKEIKDRISSIQENIKRSNAKVGPFENLVFDRPLLLETMLEVDKLFPDYTWLTSLSYDKGWAVIEGQTTSNLLTITEFKKRLESSKSFEAVEILYASLPKESEEGGEQIRDFSIRFKVKGKM